MICIQIFSLLEKSIDENSASFKQKGTFDGSRKDINAAIDRICEFTGKSSHSAKLVILRSELDIDWCDLTYAGTKIIFYDLKEPFIENLYKPAVPQSRLEAIIEPLDIVRFVLQRSNIFLYFLDNKNQILVLLTMLLKTSC